jgi:hypothetical protein
MLNRYATALVIAGGLAIFIGASAVAQPPAPQERKGPPRSRPAPKPDDNTGFTAIFDGKTLNGWEGEAGFWRVEEGAIVGETTAEKKLKLNTFLIWRGGRTADFELKAEYRITESGNSGIQYRSVGLTDVGPWVLKGYQADIDGRNNFTGMLYEERGRGFVAPRGQFVRMTEGGAPKLIGSPGESEALKSFIKLGDWNHIHVIARGISITHVINGHVMAMCLDEDAKGRAAEGLLGLQLHVGQPMKVEYRNVMLRGL